MPSETQNIILNILEKLRDEAGWSDSGMSFESPCKVGKKAGKIDLLYSVNGKELVVLEAKSEGIGQGGPALNQAKRYAKAKGTPIAIATDGSTYLETWHMKENEPLRDYRGDELSLESFPLLRDTRLFEFKKNSSLLIQIKTENEIRNIFKKLSKHGRNIGLTSGMERVVEIAKIMFIKMLCDNTILLDADDWDYLVSKDDKVSEINHKLTEIRNSSRGKIDIPALNITGAGSVGKTVTKITDILSGINLNHRYYDITGSLFQFFLSERARGGGTNDLGQYFTPKKIVSLLYKLSGYENGNRVYDPFCGTGGILTEFFLHNTNTLNSDEKKQFGKKFLFGSEISGGVSLLAKMNMVLVGDGHTNIENKDSLSGSNRYMASNKKFDVVATNMPFDPAPSEDIPDRYLKLSAGLPASAKFVEHCLNKCQTGGKVVIIVSKGFLSEKSTANFRKAVLQKYRLESVYTLYSGVFKPYTQAYSAILIISKNEPAEHIDFFHIKNDKDIDTAKRWHCDPGRYSHEYYQIPTQELINNENTDWRGLLYTLGRPNTTTIGDLVDYLEPVKKHLDTVGLLKRMGTPSSIEDGIQMVDNPNQRSGDSFQYELLPDAIVVSKIPSKRKKEGRYLGSAMVAENSGHLITQEYHQFKPKNTADLYYLLAYFRTEKFQNITELASGTTIQRLSKEHILRYPIPEPTDDLRMKAEQKLIKIDEMFLEAERARRSWTTVKPRPHTESTML